MVSFIPTILIINTIIIIIFIDYYHLNFIIEHSPKLFQILIEQKDHFKPQECSTNTIMKKLSCLVLAATLVHSSCDDCAN